MLCGASLHACAPQEQHIFNVLETNMYQQVWAQISVDPLFSVPQPRDILCAFMNLQTSVFFSFFYVDSEHSSFISKATTKSDFDARPVQSAELDFELFTINLIP